MIEIQFLNLKVVEQKNFEGGRCLCTLDKELMLTIICQVDRNEKNDPCQKMHRQSKNTQLYQLVCD